MSGSILLVGGNSVQEYGGAYYTVHNYAQHVHKLAQHAGHVDFIAGVLPASKKPTGTQLHPDLVQVHPNPFARPHRNPSGWLALQRLLDGLAGQAAGMVESFPTAGGLFSSFYRRSAPPKLVYLKTDYRERINYMLATGQGSRLSNQVRLAYYGRSQDYAVRHADAVLVRGGGLLAQYSGQVRRVEQSRPIASFDGEFAYERADSCEGDIVRLLFVGALSKRKNVLGLVTAVATAQRQLGGAPCLELVLVGGEHHTSDRTGIDEIMAHARQLGIATQVTCTGRIDDKAALAAHFREADIFVLASWEEGFPRVINEALLHSLPVISTDVGGIADDLAHGEQILLVEAGDMDAFAASICELIENPALRQTLIRNGFSWAQEVVSEPAWQQQLRLLGLA